MRPATRAEWMYQRRRDGNPPAPPFVPRNAHAPTYQVYVDAKACDRKMRYSSKGQAKQAARQSRAQHGSDLTPYRCPVCGLWHLTKRDD